MALNCAPSYTRIPGDSTATIVAAGESLKVHGVVISTTLSGSCSLVEMDGVTTIAAFSLLSNTSFELRTSFIASRGIKITTDPNVVCTIFHSSTSA